MNCGPPAEVAGPYASCLEGVWRSHPTVDSATQYLQRRLPRSSDVVSLVWKRDDPKWSDGTKWSAVSVESVPSSRPYGARSGRSGLPRIEVHVPDVMVVAIDRARGRQSRAEWVRAAIRNALESNQPFNACKTCVLKKGGM